MKIAGKRHTYMSVRISIQKEKFDSLIGFFESNPKIKKAHWFGEAIEQKLYEEQATRDMLATRQHNKL